jgi:hypothetical protein
MFNAKFSGLTTKTPSNMLLPKSQAAYGRLLKSATMPTVLKMPKAILNAVLSVLFAPSSAAA